MSALTKTFVLLHVVMSMLLAAGLIVFVNRVDNFQQTSTAQKAQLRLAEGRANEATAELAQVRASMGNVQQTSQARIQQVQAELAQRDQEMANLRTQLAQAQADAASAQASLKSAMDAQQVAQQNQGTLQGQLASLRQTHDKLMQQFTEANPRTIPTIAVIEEAQSVLAGASGREDDPFVNDVGCQLRRRDLERRADGRGDRLHRFAYAVANLP